MYGTVNLPAGLRVKTGIITFNYVDLGGGYQGLGAYLNPTNDLGLTVTPKYVIFRPLSYEGFYNEKFGYFNPILFWQNGGLVAETYGDVAFVNKVKYAKVAEDDSEIGMKFLAGYTPANGTTWKPVWYAPTHAGMPIYAIDFRYFIFY